MKRTFIQTLLTVFFTALSIAIISDASLAKTVEIAGLEATYNENAEGASKWSLDLSPAFGTGTMIAADDIAIDALGNATVTISLTQNIYVGKYIASILPGEIKYNAESGSGTLDVDVHFYLNVVGNMIDVSSVLPISKKGIADTTILLAPTAGKKVLFSARTATAYCGVNSGIIEIINGKTGDALFDVSLSMLGTKLAIGSVNMVVFFAQDAGMAARPLTDPDISGHAEGVLSVGKMRIELPVGLDFISGPETGLNIVIPEARLDISEITGGTAPIALSNIQVTNGSLTAEGAIDQTIELNSIAYKLTRIAVYSQKVSDGTNILRVVFDGSVAGEKEVKPGLIAMGSDGLVITQNTN